MIRRYSNFNPPFTIIHGGLGGTVNLLRRERLSGSGGPELLRQPWPHSIL